jgi:hypothetical protein
MVFDAKWLDALKLPLKAALVGVLATGALLLLSWKGVLDLSVFGGFARPTLLVLLVVFSALALVGVGDLVAAPLRESRRQTVLEGRRAWRRKEAEERAAEARVQALAQLDTLSREEVRYAADALRKETPSFYTYVNSPPVSLLMGKGLVWTPGGRHHEDYYPFSFRDFVWAALNDRRE